MINTLGILSIRMHRNKILKSVVVRRWIRTHARKTGRRDVTIAPKTPRQAYYFNHEVSD
jgi:hypothetical protein